MLAELASTQAASVRSFISDLGRGLILDGQSVQFLDEPTETYFRKLHPATQEVAAQVAAQLRALSGSSAYAASSLPEVLWSANLYDELLALVATDDALPSTNDVERAQVEHLRVEFGLRAAVQLRRPDSIVQLAMRAGAGRAGKSRQLTIIRDNPDLAGLRMDSRVLGELIASRELPESWPGSTLGSEAALLAHTAGGASAARSRVRQAASAIAAWVRAPRERYPRDENVTPEQVAHIALAILRTDGPAPAACYLSGWRPAHFVLESSAALARVLISSASDEEVSGLVASSSHPAVLLGVLGEMQRVGMSLDAHDASAVWTKLKRFRSRLLAEDYEQRNAEDTAFRGASWLCALAVRHSIVDATEAAERLRKCLPPSLPVGLGDRHGPGRSGILFAVALRAELLGETLDVDHYRPTLVPAKRGKYDPMKSNNEDLNRYLCPALRWLGAWAKYARGDIGPQATAALIASYSKRYSQDEIWSMSNRIARQILPLLGSAFDEELPTVACIQVIQTIAAEAPIAGALDLIPGLLGDTRFSSVVLELADAARCTLASSAETADGKAETLVHIARGLHRFSFAEAGSYFDQAVKTATGVGDDAIYRWDAIVALTRAAAGVDPADAIALAARVSRLGEAVEPITYDRFNQHQLVAALALVSGTNVFRVLGQWRDRRFGSLDWQFRGLVEGDEALFAGRPDLTTVLAPFSTNLDLNAALGELVASGGLNAKALSTANDLANRLGRSIDAEFAQPSLPDPPPANDPDEFRSTTFDLKSDEEAERSAQLEECKAQIAALDLTQVSGVDAAVRLQQESRTYSDRLFIAEVFTRPMLQWGLILDAALKSDALSDYELAKLLNAALVRPRTAQSFVDSLKRAVGTCVERYGAQLLHHNWMGFDLPAAAALLEVHTTDLLQRALDHLNLEEALTDADHCYMLAAGASAVLDPSTAARVLGEALATFEDELGISPRTVTRQAPAEPIDIAVANFLWTALGDPRSAVRWQAAHAVRTAIELGANDVIVALCSAVIRGDAAGYADERFLFYDMSAAEWFLVAVKRVARDDPSVIDALMPAVIGLSDRYPDHAAIQQHCLSVARLTTPAGHSVGIDRKAKLAEPVVLESWRRPTRPGPMIIGAPQAEYRFGSDFDEYVLGKLTDAFIITHQDVLDLASALILDEWGWRVDGERLVDPRQTAGVYQDGETYGYKWEIPKAEDLNYYLERHAALTIAGRLMRTATPYRDPDSERLDVLEWLAEFDIARHDGRWITDQRSPVPGPLATVGPRERNKVHESEFLAALKPADGWVTVWQSASVTEYDRSLSINIESALVNPEAVGAFVRALQTADGYWSFRIPSADLDDKDFQFSSPPFQLRGWVSTPNSEGGIDRLDPLATELAPELSRPSADIVEALSITSWNGGLRWERANGEAVLASETWAEISVGRERHGPSGNRLRITTEALDQMLGQLDSALIVVVQVKRKDRRAHYADVTDNDTEGGYADHDNDFRVFSYQPGTGWNDFNGRVGTRQAARG
ncbi:ATP-binding protein [Leucobacter viscericola]|uniref:ATP-binding protein n=1 Tax=Leucobacter viscericola TaxID=2714935 RepID=A0A6G7XK20_9MICO|nr:ATP-binding protein [Leucobacter viscericola]